MKRVYSSVNDRKTSPLKKIYKKIYNTKLSPNLILGTILGVMCLTLIVGGIFLHSMQNQKTKHEPPITVSAETTAPVQETTNTHADIPYVTEISASYNGPDLQEGDVIDTSNISVEATYNTGFVENVDFASTEWPATITMSLSSGANTFTISYKGLKADLTISTTPKSALSKADEYSTEYDNADIAYKSDTIWITGTKCTAEDTYMLFHILCGPDNVPKVTMNENNFKSIGGILHNAEYHGWFLGCNASYLDGNKKWPDGLYINNGELYTGDETSGHEMCITDTGELFTPEAGLSFDDLVQKHVVYTTLSDNPVLIKNGEKQDIIIDTYHTKTIIGMVAPGEYYMIVSTDGKYANNNTFELFRDLLYEKGCTYAKALSGNANTTAAFDGNVVVNPPCYNRHLPDCFAFFE